MFWVNLLKFIFFLLAGVWAAPKTNPTELGKYIVLSNNTNTTPPNIKCGDHISISVHY